MRTPIAIILLVTLITNAWAADRNRPPPEDTPMPKRWLPVDEEGWTTVKPASDSQLIYVSDIGKSRPTGRNLGWYVSATDWDGGLIAGNLFLHQRTIYSSRETGGAEPTTIGSGMRRESNQF